MDLPLVGHTFENMEAARLELDTRAGDDILDRERRQHLAGAGERGDARADVDREPGDVVTQEFDLAGVRVGARLDADRCQCSSTARHPAPGPARALRLVASTGAGWTCSLTE